MASGDEVLPAARETRPDVALLDIEMPPPVTLRARLGDGWLASGYNTTPSGFEDSLGRLYEAREAAGGSRGAFPNGIATMWRYVTEARRDAERMLGDVLAPMLGHPIDVLRDLALTIGSAEQCAHESRPTRRPAPSACSSGHSRTSYIRSSASAKTWCRSSPHPERPSAS